MEKKLALCDRAGSLYCYDICLAKPPNRVAAMLRKNVFSKPDELESKCIGCHKTVGHEREKKIYTP